VLVDPDRATSGPALLDLLAHHEVNVVQAVPMCYELMVAAAEKVGHAGLRSVDQAVVTGDALHPARLTDLARLFPAARLSNVYGCTETNDSFRCVLDTEMASAPSLPIGEPLPGVRALLVREDGSVLDGPGVGELLVSTPFQTPGYLDAPDRFVAHPEGADELRYFRSGDLVRRTASGALLLDHANVLEAAAVAVPDQHTGHRLHVLVRTDGKTNSLVLRKHCADRLPPAAIPSTMRVTEDALPRTSTGKVDRKHITENLELVG
jgi:acyl-coenzyme A synthetase/AMP-(fatty) acid ligase